jgi:hypothetical protein
MEEARHSSPHFADAAAGGFENRECSPTASCTEEQDENLADAQIYTDSTRLSLRPNVGESGELSFAEQPMSDKAQLQFTLKTLKERMKEREAQRRTLHDQLMDARRLVCEHKQAGERSRHMVQEISVDFTSETNPTTKARYHRLVSEFLEQREEHLLQACSELEHVRESASSLWHTTNEQKKELGRLEEEKIEERAEQAWKDTLLRHPAGTIALTSTATFLNQTSTKSLSIWVTSGLRVAS